MFIFSCFVPSVHNCCNPVTHQTEQVGRSCNAYDLYSEGAWFKTWLGYQLTWLRFFIDSLSSSWKIPGLYLEILYLNIILCMWNLFIYFHHHNRKYRFTICSLFLVTYSGSLGHHLLFDFYIHMHLSAGIPTLVSVFIL